MALTFFLHSLELSKITQSLLYICMLRILYLLAFSTSQPDVGYTKAAVDTQKYFNTSLPQCWLG